MTAQVISIAWTCPLNSQSVYLTTLYFHLDYKLNMNNNELISALKICYFCHLPISVNGNSIFPAVQVKSLESTCPHHSDEDNTPGHGGPTGYEEPVFWNAQQLLSS